MRHVQRLQDQRVHHAEHHRIRPDPQRQRQHRRHRESRRLLQLPDRVLHVCEHGPPPHVTQYVEPHPSVPNVVTKTPQSESASLAPGSQLPATGYRLFYPLFPIPYSLFIRPAAPPSDPRPPLAAPAASSTSARSRNRHHNARKHYRVIGPNSKSRPQSPRHKHSHHHTHSRAHPG